MNIYFKWILAAAMGVVFVEGAHAFSRRPVKVIDYEQAYHQDPSGPSSTVNYSSSGSEDMAQLAQSASDGAGDLPSGSKKALCYRSVKQIVADAFKKDLNCVRGLLSSGSAKDAGSDLEKIGFVDDRSKCTTPGVIRVYAGYKKTKWATAGDIHGHVEVLGDDGNYHSFYRSPLPMDESVSPPGRRVLTGCYVPDYNKVRSSALAKCPVSQSGSSGSSRSKGKKGQGVN